MFSSEHLHKSLDEAIKHTLALGLDQVEHIENAMGKEYLCKLNSTEDARIMKRKLDENGLSICCYSVVANLVAENADEQINRFLLCQCA